ncbi:Uridine nucleosidase 1 [Loxospora ochrophaea]|nr:Uridine nucleosidase 1 [Loxospora ochrophaea]
MQNVPFDDQVPLWLDCDPGHDDAFAILLAAHHPRLRLLGVSTVHGNASLERTTANAGRVLTAISRTDVLVYPGAAKPFSRKAVHAADIHGASGLDGTDLLPEATSPPITHVTAIVAMRGALLAQPRGTAWLVATGALTNVALLFATFPEVAGHIKGLSIMGGAIGGGFTSAPLGKVEGDSERSGNVTRWAEFNIYCDPEAAQSIFSDEVLIPKTTLIPLDVTHQVLVTQEVRQQVLERSGTTATPSLDLRQMFYELLMFFAHTYSAKFGISAGPPLHDPIAVAVLFWDCSEEDLEFDDREGERWQVRTVTEGIHSDMEQERKQLGRTVAIKVDKGTPGVRIPRGLDIQRFWSILVECLSRAEAKIAA